MVIKLNIHALPLKEQTYCATLLGNMLNITSICGKMIDQELVL